VADAGVTTPAQRMEAAWLVVIALVWLGRLRAPQLVLD